MRALCLPVVSQLRHRPLLASGNENRVVTEALVAARLVCDPALERPGATQLAAVGREEDELGDVARATVLAPFELAEELRDRRRTLGRVTRREHPRPPAERFHLEPGVLRKHPAAGVLATESRLERRVVVVRRAGLRRVVVAIQRLDRPAGQQRLELPRLVRVAGAEDCVQSVHRTSSTPSISATSATTAGAEPAASSTSMPTERRSPS